MRNVSCIQSAVAFLLPCLLTVAVVLLRGHWSAPTAAFAEENAQLLFLRLTESLAAFTVGAALSMAGVGCQAILRNDLAEPYILGVSGGASIGAALTILAGFSAIPFALQFGSFAGALAALGLVLLLANAGRNGSYSTGVLLCGVIVGTLCSSLLMFLISIMDQQELNSITWWMLGSLQFCSAKLLFSVLGVTVLCTVLLFCFGRAADAAALGSEMAHDFGVSYRGTALLLLVTAALLAAGSVALAGIIGFVGLIVPHILRRLFGAGHRVLFPAAFFGGGLFLVWCDLVSQTLSYEQEIPVGVITALLGGPFFLYLLHCRNREGQI